MDIILCATRNHKDYVQKMYPELRSKIYTLKEYAQSYTNNEDIRDPWGYDIHTYEEVAEEIKKCLEVIIDKCN